MSVLWLLALRRCVEVLRADCRDLETRELEIVLMDGYFECNLIVHMKRLSLQKPMDPGIHEDVDERAKLVVVKVLEDS
jgi:hypothetical protein